MKLEVGKQYKTRDGHRVVCVDIDRIDDNIPYRLWHENTCTTLWHKKDGIYHGSSRELDIISEWVEPLKGEFWVNIYNNKANLFGCFSNDCNEYNFTTFASYSTKEDADKPAEKHRIACVKVSWTEGDGL